MAACTLSQAGSRPRRLPCVRRSVAIRAPAERAGRSAAESQVAAQGARPRRDESGHDVHVLASTLLGLFAVNIHSSRAGAGGAHYSGATPKRSLVTLGAHVAACSRRSLAGCAVGPNFHRPEPPKEAGYTVAPLPDKTTATPGPSGDAQQFVDGPGCGLPMVGGIRLRGHQCLGRAGVSRQSDGRAPRRRRCAQAQEMVYAQQGYFWPSVGADYNFERQKLPGNTAATAAPGVQGNGQVLRSECDLLSRSSTTFTPHSSPWDSCPMCSARTGARSSRWMRRRRTQRFELEATYITSRLQRGGRRNPGSRRRARSSKATREIIAHNREIGRRSCATSPSTAMRAQWTSPRRSCSSRRRSRSCRRCKSSSSRTAI